MHCPQSFPLGAGSIFRRGEGRNSVEIGGVGGSEKKKSLQILDLQRLTSLLRCGLHINYSPKWRWLEVIFTKAAKRRGKFPPLPTDTEVNNCFSIYKNSEIIEHNSFTVANDYILARQERTAAVVAISCRQIKLLKAFVQLLRGNFCKKSCEIFLYLKSFRKKDY